MDNKDTKKQNFLLQDFALQENISAFVREKTPERVISAKGSGAYGSFVVNKDITKYTKAKLFSKINNKCKVFVRFSAVSGEKGTPDTTRDIKGFAIKFYTEDGNWDLVGSNSPIFFVKDAKKFPKLIQSQKKDPKTNLRNETKMWDYWSKNPETLHQLLILMSDRGTPYSYRFMNGYGGHSYSFINDKNERFWVKFHLKTQQGIKNFTNEEAEKIAGSNPDFYQEDLINAIEKGNYPKWTLYIQVMTEAEACEFRWNPFDVTKIWPQTEFPLIEVGELELNQVPEDYYSHTELATFAPSNVVAGIAFSPDKVLQSRIFAYPDAQRYRVGVNAHNLEVNRSNANYTEYLNWDTCSITHFENENTNENDHYTQAGLFYTKALNETEKTNLINNIVHSLNKIKNEEKNDIINRQLCHFFRTNIELGMKVSIGLGLDINNDIMQMMNHK